MSVTGASPEAIYQSVTRLIEEQLNGAKGLLYFESTSDASGRVQINVTFEPGTNPEEAAVEVQNRIARLEREGVIAGYTVRLKPQAEARRIRALMTLAVEGNRTQQVLRSLRGLPQVGTLYSTNGRWDIVAELQAETLEAFDHALGAVRQIEGVASTETSILLSTY